MVDEVRYEVLRKVDRIEIRRYPSLVLATVRERSDNSSFRTLFDYIRGNNRTNKRVPMTSPVITGGRIPMTSPVLSGEDAFSFVLPEGYDKESTPIPNDPGIRIDKIPSRLLAVLRFSGRVDRQGISEKNKELVSILKKEHITFKGHPMLMRYNSPFMPGPFRRNEVAVEVLVLDIEKIFIPGEYHRSDSIN